MNRGHLPQAPVSRFVIPGVCLAILGLAAGIRLSDPALYRSILSAWMLFPFDHPFMDWEWIPSVVECWQRGIDVYVDNTCYAPIAHGRHSYSPLWLRATFLPTSADWVAPAGLALAVAFALSLALLPPSRSRRAFWLVLLAATSSTAAYAVERGNVDLLIFVLALAGVWLWSKGLTARLAAYAVFSFIGLLKFYPMVLMALALRERVRVLFAVALGSAAVVGLFLLRFHGEIAAALGNVPTSSYFRGWIGAANLPQGIALLWSRRGMQGLDPSEALSADAIPVAAILLALMAVAAFALAIWLAKRQGIREAVAAMPEREIGFAAAGALLICGCFFAGQNVTYRGIFLLLSLPGLARLSETLPRRPARCLLLGTCIAIVLLLWEPTGLYAFRVFTGRTELRGLVAVETSSAARVYWAVRELAWWWIVSVLLSVLASFIANTPLRRALRARTDKPALGLQRP